MEVTFHGLNEWYKAMFEKLGWMILAKEHKKTLKVKSYLKSISDLKASIEHRLTEIQDPDKKHDLTIMHRNVKHLVEGANKLLK